MQALVALAAWAIATLACRKLSTRRSRRAAREQQQRALQTRLWLHLVNSAHPCVASITACRAFKDERAAPRQRSRWLRVIRKRRRRPPRLRPRPLDQRQPPPACQGHVARRNTRAARIARCGDVHANPGPVPTLRRHAVREASPAGPAPTLRRHAVREASPARQRLPAPTFVDQPAPLLPSLADYDAEHAKTLARLATEPLLSKPGVNLIVTYVWARFDTLTTTMEQGRAFVTVEKVLRMQTVRFQGWLDKSARSLRVPLIKARWRFERDADTTHDSWFPAPSPDPLKCCGDTQEAVRFRFMDIAAVKLPDAVDVATKNPTWATSPRANFVQSAEEFKELVAENHALHRCYPRRPLC